MDFSWLKYCDPKNLEELNEEELFIVNKTREQSYPIVDKIPRFVSNENYADAFGFQWNRYRLTQLDSYTKTKISENRLRRCLGENLWNSLHGLRILEAGCGAGRFTEVLLSKGAQVVSVDLSNAVDANGLSFPPNAQHKVIQANLLKLPFFPEQFDVVLCLGVLQHTPNPEHSIQALSKHIRIGGRLVIDHYTSNLWTYPRVATLLRPLLIRLEPRRSALIVDFFVRIFLPWHRLVRGSRVFEFLLSRVSPVLTYYRIFPELSEKAQIEWAYLDTYDSLTDYFKHFRSKDQLETSVTNLGLKIEYSAYAGNGVEIRSAKL
jgi:2-polyprenyl-3-methyl-5-hydroxy-6-metoxy-1,4-benzoquinol methylase